MLYAKGRASAVMKFETHAEYDPRQSEMVKRAFLSVWSSFPRWHDDVVLLGGLVPKFICKPLPDGFAEEVRAGNPACRDAIRCLETLFKDEQAPGPMRASHFLLGPPGESGHPDEAFRRTQIRQQMVDVAAALRRVL